MTEAEQIAAKLTEAHAKSLLHGRCGVPRSDPEWTDECICGAPCAGDLVMLNLAYRRVYFPGGIIPTPLGLQVRAILKEQQP